MPTPLFGRLVRCSAPMGALLRDYGTRHTNIVAIQPEHMQLQTSHLAKLLNKLFNKSHNKQINEEVILASNHHFSVINYKLY